MRAALRACFAVGVRGAANPLVGLEVLVAGALALSLAFATHEPEARPVTVICRKTDVVCPRIEGDIEAEMREAGR